MADIKWIKIATDIFEDEKIILIKKSQKGNEILLIWFEILCLCGKQNNNGILVMNNGLPYTSDMLATIFRRKKSVVDLALDTFEKFGMVERFDGVYRITNWEKHQNAEQLEKIREQNRLRKQRQREKDRDNLRDKNVTVTESHATEEDKEIEEEIDKDIEYVGGGNILPPPPPPTIVTVTAGSVKSENPVLESIRDAWNSIDHVEKIRDIVPCTARYTETMICVDMYGLSDVLAAINKVRNSKYLKKRGHTKFDSFINRNSISKLLEGSYDVDYEDERNKKTGFQNFEQRDYADDLEERLINR